MKETSDWTDERWDLCKSLWSMGASARQIGIALQVSRSAVLGKLWRAGLKPVGQRAFRPRPKLFEKSSRPLVRVEGAASQSFNDTSGPSYSILDLGAIECRWPIGDNPMCFCAALKETLKSPYCPQHNLVATREAH